uniref:Uncharacterized protein n=1 Tax=Anguilla anguilla TaxID=7936 RepID=A0A0E9XV44_ANGAN
MSAIQMYKQWYRHMNMCPVMSDMSVHEVLQSSGSTSAAPRESVAEQPYFSWIFFYSGGNKLK